MINYLTILLIGLLALSAVEVCLDGFPKMQKQIYYLAFAFAAVWCTIKFAIGPDILVYLDLWEHIGGLEDTIRYDDRIEPGFATFCWLCKHAGISYWGMTAIVSVIFFAAVAMTIHYIPHHQTSALTAWMVLDYNLVLYEHRQCLAVSMIVIAYWMMKHKKNILAIILALIACGMHKSAIFILLIAAAIYCCRGLKIDQKAYILLGGTMLCLTVVPINGLWDGIVGLLPIPATIRLSISHHLQTGKVVQLILPFYLTVMACLAYYVTAKKKEDKTWHWMIFCCIAIMVVLYQSWFLLNRLRSYVLPFLLIYIMNTLYDEEIKDKMPRQILTLVFFAYSALFTYGNAKAGQKLVSRCNAISTVIERKDHSNQYLEKRQMDEAIKFWTYDHEEKLFGSTD
ncbi:MAG: EpsG family protein [Paludibacteraceae bacterium]|nr:EpsG family protein [Paludibacteraceae bacterium]